MMIIRLLVLAAVLQVAMPYASFAGPRRSGMWSAMSVQKAPLSSWLDILLKRQVSLVNLLAYKVSGISVPIMTNRRTR